MAWKDPDEVLARFEDKAAGIASLVFPQRGGFSALLYDTDAERTVALVNHPTRDRAICTARDMVPEGRQTAGPKVRCPRSHGTLSVRR